MKLSAVATVASLRLMGVLAPPSWGAALALPALMAVARPAPVAPDDEATMWRARRSRLRVRGVDGNGAEVVTYEWGSGDRTVVLVHGWNGRASQFATLARELVAEGYRVVAFDAPAHGASSGRRTYIHDWTDALDGLQRDHGAFEMVIGHSFGALAAVVAAAAGLETRSLVTIAAPAGPDTLLTQFQRLAGYSPRITPALRRRFAARYFPEQPDPLPRLSAEQVALAPDMAVLVVHDEDDRMVPFGDAERIVAAHPAARMMRTRGLGHNRMLRDDILLDAVIGFGSGLPARMPVP